MADGETLKQSVEPSFNHCAIDLREIDYVIFDMDGTLYPYKASAVPEYNKGLAAHLNNTIFQSHHDLTTDVLYEDLKETYAKTGLSISNLMEEFPKRAEEIRAAATYFQDTILTPDSYVCDVFVRNQSKRLALLLAQIGATMPKGMSIFTHSPKASMHSVLEHINIADIFADCVNLSACDIARSEFKDQSAVRFQQLADEHEVECDRVLLFEDSGRNTVTAKELGMKTCLLSVDYANAVKEHGETVDWHASDIITVLETLVLVKSNPVSRAPVMF